MAGEKRTNPFALLSEDSQHTPKKRASESFEDEVDTLMLHITTGSSNSSQPGDADAEDREQRRKLKKMRKKNAKLQQQVVNILPNFDHLQSKRHNIIKIKDWINLAQHLLHVPGVGHPSWASVMNLNSVNQVVVLYIPQLSPELIRFSDGVICDHLPAIKRFHHFISTCGPAEKTRLQSAQQEMLTVPLSPEQRKELRNAAEKYQAYSEMILSEEELEENLYPVSWEAVAKDLSIGRSAPLTVEEVASQWVSTSRNDPSADDEFIVAGKNKHSIYALDCEMCITKMGLEIARVTLVDLQRNVVYDKFLLPENPILDYNTRFSGITKEHMEGVTLALPEVQKHLLEFIREDTILVGHSLENDLKRLRFIHNRIIDTAILYHSSKGPPNKPSLRHLSQQHLEKVIQSGEDGHDSAVDAITCLELIALKMRMGRSFGLSTKESECLLERLTRNNIECGIVNCHGYEKFSGSWDTVKSRKFIFYKLKHLEWSSEDTVDSVPISEKLTALNKEITDIMEDLPKNTVVIGLSGHGDTKAASSLLTQRRDYNQLVARLGASEVHDNMKDKVFDQEKMTLLEQEIRKAKVGVGMVWVKHD